MKKNQSKRPVRTEHEKDLEFLKEFSELCKKHSRHIIYTHVKGCWKVDRVDNPDQLPDFTTMIC